MFGWSPVAPLSGLVRSWAAGRVESRATATWVVFRFTITRSGWKPTPVIDRGFAPFPV